MTREEFEELGVENIEDGEIDDIALDRMTAKEVSILTFKKICSLEKRVNKNESVTQPVSWACSAVKNRLAYVIGWAVIAGVGFATWWVVKMIMKAKGIN